MPRFYNQDDPDLSDLNRAKKSVNRDYAKQYSAQDGNHDNLGQSADKDAKFNALNSRLTSLFTSLIDLGQALSVPVQILDNPIASFKPAQVGQLQQLSSRILSEIRAVSTLFSSIKSFNIFTPPEAQQLQQLVEEVKDAHNLIVGASQLLGNSPTAQQIDGVINVFTGELLLLLQFLDGASNNYRAIEGYSGGGKKKSPAELKALADEVWNETQKWLDVHRDDPQFQPEYYGMKGYPKTKADNAFAKALKAVESALCKERGLSYKKYIDGEYFEVSGGVALGHRATTMTGGYSFQDAFQSLGDFGRSQKDNVYAFKLADDARIARTGGAIVPAYNGEGRFGSDGYRIGDYFTYTDPRRFY